MNKKELPLQVVVELGLVLTDKSTTDSFVRGLVYYETKQKGCYLTNCDELAGDVTEKDLSIKDMWMIFYLERGRGTSMKITTECLMVINEKVFYEHVRVLKQKLKSGIDSCLTEDRISEK